MVGKWHGRLEIEPKSVHKELWGQLSLSSRKLQSCALGQEKEPGDKAP